MDSFRYEESKSTVNLVDHGAHDQLVRTRKRGLHGTVSHDSEHTDFIFTVNRVSKLDHDGSYGLRRILPTAAV